MNRLLSAGLAALSAGLVVIGVAGYRSAAVAQDSSPTTKPAMGNNMNMSAAGGQDEMAGYMKAISPGPQHEKLKEIAGDFNCEVKFRMAPDQPEQVSHGYTKNEMMFQGRFLRQEYGGDFMGQPFHGVGYIGFDNSVQKYVATWLDEMSTGILNATGMLDATGKVLTFTGQFNDPMAGGAMKPYKEVLTIQGPDKHVSVWYDVAPDGKEFKSMEITYTRK